MIVMINRATKSTFSCLKNKKKKGYIEMIEKFYLET